MKIKNLLTAIMLVFTTCAMAQWGVYDGSVLPGDNDPAFDASCNEPGVNTAAIIVDDADIPGNQVLNYLSPDNGGRMAYKIDFADWTSQMFTMAVRMKGIEGIDTLDQLFDIEIRNGSAGVRDKVFIKYDNSLEIDNPNVNVDLGFDVNDWHIYRVTMNGDQVNVYVDESETPIASGVTTSSTSDLQFKLADCSGGTSQGAIVDWIIWNTEGAYAPGEGPAIPAGLSTATGNVFDPTQYKIAFLTKDVTENGDLEEAGLINDLRKRGFDVDVTYNDPNDIVVTPDFEFTFEALADYDLVILGRGVSSGDFTDPAVWAEVETPVIVFSAYLVRNSRMNLVNSGSASRELGDGALVDMARVNYAAYVDNPLFTGVDTDEDGEYAHSTWFYDYLGYGADTFEANHNATLLSALRVDSAKAANTVAMAYWAAGDETYPGSGTTNAGARAFFSMGSDDSNSPKIRNFTAFTDESTIVFHNLIKMMVGAEPDGIEIPISGPVARYRFEGSEETIVDAVGSAFGDIRNGNGITREDCGVGNSVNFAGATKAEAIIWVDDNAAINFDGSGSFSVSMWAKIDPHSNVAEMNLILKGDNRNDGTHLENGNGHYYTLATKDNELRFAIDDDVVKTQLGVAIDETSFPAGQWNHIVGVRDFDQDSLFLYLNGALIGSIHDETDMDMSTTGLPLVIGNYHSGARKVNGNLDEIEIWDRALTSTDIMDLYTANTPTDVCNVLETISEASDDASLAALSLDVGTLSPAFDPAIPNYSAEVPEGTTTVNITATANHPAATLVGDGPFMDIPGTAKITVTAEDGASTQDYNISITVEGAGNARTIVEPGFGTLTTAIENAVSGDTLVLQNGQSYSPLEPYNINKNIVIIAEEIPSLPGLANMPKIDNLFGTSPVFQMGFGGYLVLIGIDVDGGQAANIINCQGDLGVPSTSSIYINRCRLHNTTDDIMNDARDGNSDMTSLERCVVRNSFIYDSGAGHGLYVKNFHGLGEFVFENLTVWNLGQQFNWIRHYPTGIQQPFIYDHITGYRLSTDESQNKEIFGNSDSEAEAALDIQLKNSIWHTQVSSNEGSFKFNNTTGQNSIVTRNNVLFNVQPIVDLGGTITHEGNMEVDPQFADPDNGDFTVMNTDLHTAADDGKIVGATYWLPGFIDDFSDLTNVDELNKAKYELRAYPNPFNEAVNISFHLERSADVAIYVHNMMGEVVVVMDQLSFTPGTQIVEIPTQTLTPGMYVYRFVSDGVVISDMLVKSSNR